MNGYRQNIERAKIAVIMLATLFAVIASSIIARFWQLGVIADYQLGAADIAQLQLTDNVVRILALAYIVVFILSATFFIRWFRRAYYNIICLRPEDGYYTEGWAAGAWFVPFMNLIRPYRIMQELWQGTLKLINGNSDIEYPSNLLRAWWITWLLYNFVRAGSSWLTMMRKTIDSIKLFLALDIIGYSIGLLSLICIILIVRKYAELEKRVEEAISLPQDSIFALNTNIANYQTDNYGNEIPKNHTE